MDEDNLILLADVSSWLSETENRIKEINHKNSKKRNFTALTIGDSFKNHTSSSSSLSLSNQNSAEFLLSGVAKKKRTPMVRRRNHRLIRAENPPIVSLEDRIRAAGGEGLRLVMEKPLTLTDLSYNHGRLSMPNSSLSSTFLRADEASRVRGQKGLWVPVVDEGGREYNLRLKQWSMGGVPIFNLNGGWNSVVADNSLCHKDVVQLWSFRRGSRLCFAFVKPQD